MAGYLLLEGGAEFGGRMAEPDRRAIELAGGVNARITIIPTAAAPDHNHQRAGNNGMRWFRELGATSIELLPLIDRASANDAHITASLRQSRLIYMLGGFTGYLGETLKGSESERAMREAYEAGAIIAGSSAGAMVMCQYYINPGGGRIAHGLNFIPNTCVLPHHNTFGKRWAAQVTQMLPHAVLLGIDEQTGMIDEGGDKTHWRVYGRGAVTIYRNGQPTVYSTGQEFQDDFS